MREAEKPAQTLRELMEEAKDSLRPTESSPAHNTRARESDPDAPQEHVWGGDGVRASDGYDGPICRRCGVPDLPGKEPKCWSLREEARRIEERCKERSQAAYRDNFVVRRSLAEAPPHTAPARESDLKEAEATFAAYFRRNYPGPDTVIGRPDWHSPKLWRAALYALGGLGPEPLLARIAELEEHVRILSDRDFVDGLGEPVVTSNAAFQEVLRLRGRVAELEAGR